MQQTSAWRYFPHGLIAALGLVAIVNGYMVYSAVSTFPGQAGVDGFDLSNEYGKVLAVAKAQAALGWTIDASMAKDKRPVLRLTDKAGAVLKATEIDATAERPVGPKETTKLVFAVAPDGTYHTETTLWSGQWDIMLAVKADGHEYRATRRVVVQ